MATKRTHDEMETAGPIHPSRRPLLTGSNRNMVGTDAADPDQEDSRKKPRRFVPKAKNPAYGPSFSEIKGRIKALQRTLKNNPDLEADVRVEHEHRIATYEQELVYAEAEKIMKKKRQELIAKYHKIRFHDRKKATRALKKLKRAEAEAEATSPEELESLKSKIHIAEVDLNYTLYHPLMDRYCSLWPPKDPSATEEDTAKVEPKPKPEIWAEVEKAMAEGTLEQLKIRTPPITHFIAKHTKIQPKEKSKEKRVEASENDGEESDEIMEESQPQTAKESDAESVVEEAGFEKAESLEEKAKPVEVVEENIEKPASRKRHKRLDEDTDDLPKSKQSLSIDAAEPPKKKISSEKQSIPIEKHAEEPLENKTSNKSSAPIEVEGKHSRSKSTRQQPAPSAWMPWSKPSAQKEPPHPVVDATGLNRRQRRKLMHEAQGTLIKAPKTKNKSIGFAKNQAFGASLNTKKFGAHGREDDDSDGGFFE